jgi:hypothetical protein
MGEKPQVTHDAEQNFLYRYSFQLLNFFEVTQNRRYSRDKGEYKANIVLAWDCGGLGSKPGVIQSVVPS